MNVQVIAFPVNVTLLCIIDDLDLYPPSYETSYR